jgi:hypothetical protein
MARAGTHFVYRHLHRVGCICADQEGEKRKADERASPIARIMGLRNRAHRNIPRKKFNDVGTPAPAMANAAATFYVDGPNYG